MTDRFNVILEEADIVSGVSTEPLAIPESVFSELLL